MAVDTCDTSFIGPGYNTDRLGWKMDAGTVIGFRFLFFRFSFFLLLFLEESRACIELDSDGPAVPHPLTLLVKDGPHQIVHGKHLRL